MEDDNLYDEFGNYIGPQMDISEGSDSDSGDASDSDARRQGGEAGSGSASSNYAYEKPVSYQRIFAHFDLLTLCRMENEWLQITL